MKILIVEDDPITAHDLKETLISCKFQVTGICRSYDDALKTFGSERPEALLVDISLKGDKTGIDLVKTINSGKHICPVVYLTGNSDTSTKQDAFQTNPSVFLTKPFYPDTVVAALELAIDQFNRKQDSELKNSFNHDLFVKKGDQLLRVNTKNIQCFKAEGSYCRVYTEHDEFVVSGNLKVFAEKFHRKFTRIHRSFVINNDQITSMDTKQIHVKNRSFPIGRKYRDKARDILNLGVR